MKILFSLIFIGIFFIYGCNAANTEVVQVQKQQEEKTDDNEVVNVKLTSTVFEHNGKIPSEYTCDGEDISPELMIEDVPAGAKSLALVMDDPDVPKHIRPDGLWVHWVVWNIPTDTKKIAKANEPEGVQGITNFGRTGYGGPCPPDREHRYFFKLYALDTSLDIPEGSTKDVLEKAMEGNIIEQTELIGMYEKK